MSYTKQNFEDGQVLTAQHLNNMEDGIKAVSEEIADYSWNDLKDRPFGDEMVEIMPETEVAGEYDEFDEVYLSEIDTSLLTGDEETLFVTFDGVEYTCNVNNDYGLPVYGNLAFFGMDDTGEPFLITPMLGCAYLADEEPHTVKITSVIVDKLDSKYVNVSADFYVSANPKENDYIYTDSLLEKKATVAEVQRAARRQAVKVNVCIGTIVGSVCAPIFISWVNGFGEIVVRNWKATSGGSEVTFYTAEYTPET